MVNINLLPWRDWQRNYQKNAMRKIICACLLLACALLFVVHLSLKSQQEKALLHVSQLKQILNDYHADLSVQQYKRLASDQVHNLMRYADSTEQLLRSLARHHSALCFSAIKRNKNSLFFHGKTNSASDLTLFLQHWEAANLFAEIRIKAIERLENHLLQFYFQALADIPLVDNQESTANDTL